MALAPKASRPRNTPLLTRNGRIRIKQLSVTKLTEMAEKSSSKRVKGKVIRRLLLLAKKNK
jgi:hypothetical protein